MTITIQAPHDAHDADKLADVRAYMVEHGAPVIRAYYDGEIWLAVEGSHRIAVAAELGLTPEIVEVEWDDEIDHDAEDVEGRRVADLIEYFDQRGPVYRFD